MFSGTENISDHAAPPDPVRRLTGLPAPEGEIKGGIIKAGQQAWQRLRERDRKAWPDWLVVGHALVIGRAEAMQVANTNRPFGLTYNRAIGSWLIQNGLDGINNQDRYRVILCIENLAAIEEWLATLAPEKRLKLNHPNAVWWRWQKSTKAPRQIPSQVTDSPRPRRPNAGKGALGGAVAGTTEYSGRAIFWSGDAIRRAADAMRESRSTDFYVMARKALEAAIRSESDLMAILPDADRRQA